MNLRVIKNPGRGRGRYFRKEEPYKVNSYITAPLVRIVGDDIKSDIYPIKEAIAIAEEAGLDLVEISPKAAPPVCRIVDYKKFLYEQKKKQKEIKAKSTKIIVKELRYGPNTDEHDFNFKLKHAEKFLQEGAKVKAYVFFKGRTILFKEKGEILLLKLAQSLEEFGIVESMPKLEGKKMIMILAPKKVKSKK